MNGVQMAGGEPVLIPDPSSSASDSVFVGTFAIDPLDPDFKSYFIVYSGSNCSNEPVFALEMPSRVPFGFHGLWVAEEALQEHLRGGT